MPGERRRRRWPLGPSRPAVPAWAAASALVIVFAAGGSARHGGTFQRQGLTYRALAAQAVSTLEQRFYNGAGKWNLCLPLRCTASNQDWGADSLTYDLYLHWLISHDQGVLPIMDALTATAPATHNGWSDAPVWDAIAAVREYQVTANPAALAKAKAAFAYVAVTGRSRFALGACPSIYYQQPSGGTNKLKTLETGSNYIKAALLLYQVTKDPSYLGLAEKQYAAVRRYFLDRSVPLYTVYVFDSGSACTALPARYFASVNGNMIWAGYYLARATGNGAYLSESVATAQAVRQHLGDASGAYEDLQAENDVAEPLVEAMYVLAAAGHQTFARDWLLTMASAAASSVAADGAYARFFGGPAPAAVATAWQVNGGLAVIQAAAALDPLGGPAQPAFWAGASFVAHDLVLGSAPVQFTFTGRAVAIIGTIGEHCCEPGHAQVFIDGTETFDHTGIWQNKSSSGMPLPGSVLLAWRWPRPGTHTVQIRPGIPNAKEGGSFFHMTGYYLVK